MILAIYIQDVLYISSSIVPVFKRCLLLYEPVIRLW